MNPPAVGAGPWWAVLTVWGVVNAVNVLQAAGFLSRVPTGSMAVNHVLGRIMIGLAIPARDLDDQDLHREPIARTIPLRLTLTIAVCYLKPRLPLIYVYCTPIMITST